MGSTWSGSRFLLEIAAIEQVGAAAEVIGACGFNQQQLLAGDAEVTRRYGALLMQASRGELHQWRDELTGRLAVDDAGLSA